MLCMEQKAKTKPTSSVSSKSKLVSIPRQEEVEELSDKEELLLNLLPSFLQDMDKASVASSETHPVSALSGLSPKVLRRCNHQFRLA